MRWARISLCVLGGAAALLALGVPATGATGDNSAVVVRVESGPLLTLTSQTSWVSPAAPWFSLAVGVAGDTGPVDDLRVAVTVYGKIVTASDMAASTTAVPDERVLTRFDAPIVPIEGALVAQNCAAVLPDSSASPPATAPANAVACPAGAPTVTLGCVPGDGTCGGVYPVSVALERQGSTSPLARFTTFLTYQEPGLSSSVGTGGALRVSLIVPISRSSSPALSTPSAAELSRNEALVGVVDAHREVAVTLAADPGTVSALLDRGGKPGQRSVTQLQSLTVDGTDQLLTAPYVPVDVAALAGAGLAGEINAQLLRGNTLLRSAGLHPTPGTWVDTSPDFTSADADNLDLGLQAAGASRMILSDDQLTPAHSDAPNFAPLTYAQPFSLALGRSAHVTAAGASSQVDSLFTADPGDPVLTANQILATLEFLHFEDPYTPDPRGVVVDPPPSWQPSTALMTTLLDGMAGNPVLSPVTLNDLFTQVPKGGNGEPAVRHLRDGSPPRSATIPPATAARLASARVSLSSFGAAVIGHPAVLTELSDLLLATEYQGFGPAARSVALNNYTRRFTAVLSLVSLADQGPVTFTSRTAPIPVSVLSSAPFRVRVVLTLSSDKFTFPQGASRSLTLDRPTTPVRVQARSRTSGDRLPVDATLTTPDGQLVIAHTVLTVHATSISLVGIALTALAAVVLLVWWIRTWRRGPKRRPRAA